MNFRKASCYFIMTFLIFAISCGRSRLAPPRPVSPVAPLTNTQVTAACGVPLAASLVKVSPASTVTTADNVLWQVHMSGGCGTSYEIKGMLTNAPDGFVYMKKYSAPGPVIEQITVIAHAHDGTVLDTKTAQSQLQVIAPLADVFNCTISPIPASATSSGTYDAIANAFTVPLDATGAVVKPIPSMTFAVTFTLNGVSTTGLIAAVNSSVPNKHVILSTALPTSEVPAANLTLSFSDLGPNFFILNATKGTNQASCSSGTTVNGVAPPSWIKADPSTVAYNSTTQISWAATPGAQQCAVTAKGSLTPPGIADQLVLSTALAGKITSAPLTQNTTYTLNCDGKSVSAKVTVALPDIALFFDSQNNPLAMPPASFGLSYIDKVNATSAPYSSICKNGIRYGVMTSGPYSEAFNPTLNASGNPSGIIGFDVENHTGTAISKVVTNLRTISIGAVNYGDGSKYWFPFIHTDGKRVILTYEWTYYDSREIDLVPYEIPLRLEATSPEDIFPLYCN